MGRVRLLAGLLVVLMTSGCNPFSEAGSMMDEYVKRVGRVLEVEPVLSDVPPGVVMPSRRDRLLELPELDMGMLDFLSLYGCELQYVVGEKNSVMGRVMQPLNRLRYELRFIDAANACLPTIESEALQDSLRIAAEHKRASLRLAVWNATWGVEEVESLLTLSKGPLPVALSADAVTDLAIDIERLNEAVTRLLAGDLDHSLADLGSVHQRWQAEHLAGQAISSALLLTTRLRDASALIRQRLDGRPLCLQGKPNNQSDIVRNMFFSVFIERIQPYMADVRRVREAVVVPLNRLAHQQAPVMPDAFADWYQRMLALDDPDSVWMQLDHAMQVHIESWQLLLDQCGMRPAA